MIAGHLPATYLLHETFFRNRLVLPDRVRYTATLFAAGYLPDLVDHSLNHLLGWPTRGYLHSLVLLNLLAVGFLLWRRTTLLYFFIAAANLHILMDGSSLPQLLYPLLGMQSMAVGAREDILMVLYNFYIARLDPAVFYLEMMTIVMAVGHWCYYRRRAKPLKSAD